MEKTMQNLLILPSVDFRPTEALLDSTRIEKSHKAISPEPVVDFAE